MMQHASNGDCDLTGVGCARLRGRDGLYRWFLARAIPFRDAQGNALGWYGVNIEIEQQKIAFGEIARIAEILQHAYLPEQLPEVAGVRFDAVYVPAARPALIGGDWYDVEELPSGSVCISMGDVGGHGIEASVVASRIRQAIATLAIEYEDPALVLRKVNRAFMRRAERVFATGAVAIVAKDRRSMRYSSAGHPPPLIAHASDRAVALLEFDGIPLGIQTELQNWNTKVQLSRGDLIAFYTDGLVEASRDVLSGIWKLQASLRRFVAPEVDAEIAQRILEDVLGDEPSSDDVALLVARILS